MFAKETPELTREVISNIQSDIDALIPTTAILDNESTIFVNHQLLLTMINGKTCTAITAIPSQNCQICEATPSQMNNIEFDKNIKKKKQKKTGDPNGAETSSGKKSEELGYGISVLHTNIRCMELILHIAFCLDVKSWMILKNEDKEKVRKRKKNIQDQFRKETGLLLDVVLQGKGNINDGNTARRVFKHYQKTAEITGVDVRLVERLRNLLIVINSGKKINVENFRQYSLDTMHLYESLYDWYYLPTHIHKLLLHGADIIGSMLLPICQLSEEAAEANNKIIRQIRRDHTRKTSRTDTNRDLMNMLLANSDPYISSLRKCKSKKREELPLVVRPLLDESSDDEEYSSEEDDL